MGNCFGRGSSSTIWAGEDWESLSTTEDDPPAKFDKQRLLGHLKASSSSSSSSSVTEVKIKITKKELEALLGQAQAMNLTSEEVLARLVKASSGRFTVHQHHHHWRPGLTSIPEVN